MDVVKPLTAQDAMELIQRFHIQHQESPISPGMGVQILKQGYMDESETFEPALVISVSDESAVVQVESTGSIEEVDIQDIFQQDPNSLKGIPDMANIEILHEAALLTNLLSRYEKRQIYTRIGKEMIVMNPYQEDDKLYAEIDPFVGKEYFEGEPHIYEVAQNVWNKILRYRENQVIVLSGESGSGKTEASKQISSYLVVCAACSDDLEGQILAAGSVLDAFGNAKTYVNDNSTRFCRFAKLMVDINNKWITGIKFETSLLEKSRVTDRKHGDRNFHIFYMMLQLDQTEFQGQLGIDDDAKTSDYLKGDWQCESLDDLAWGSDLVESFEILKIGKEKLLKVLNVLVAILWLGSVQFDLIKMQIKNQSLIQKLARNLETSGQQITQILQECHDEESFYKQRDLLAQNLYERCFNWIVNKVNKSFKYDSNSLFIGIVDYTGLEALPNNEFEQLLVNYTNEKFLQLFINKSIKQEIQFMEQEGLQQINYSLDFLDNFHVLDLLENKDNGILTLVDESTRNNTDDIQLLTIFQQLYMDNENIEFSELDKEMFMLRHTANDIDYLIEGFSQKNMSPQFYPLNSRNELYQEFLNTSVYSSPTIATEFQNSLNDLIQELTNLELTFVKFVKPNTDKLAWTSNSKIVLTQIQFLSVLDTISVSRQGFPYRPTYKQFYDYFCHLGDFGNTGKLNYREEAQKILDQNLPGLTNDYILMGNTRIFLRNEVWQALDYIRKSLVEPRKKAVEKLEFWWKQNRYHQYDIQPVIENVQIVKKTVIIDQTDINEKYVDKPVIISVKQNNNAKDRVMSLIKGYFDRRDYDIYKYENECATKLQAAYRGSRFRQKNPHLLIALQQKIDSKLIDLQAVKLQRFFKGLVVRNKLSRMEKAASKIQSFLRAKWTQESYQDLRQDVIKIQRATKNYLAWKRQADKRMNKYLEKEMDLLKSLQWQEHQKLFSTQIHLRAKSPTKIYNQKLAALAQNLHSQQTTGSLALQTKQVSPFHIERMYFFNRIIDIDILTDLSIIYDPSWADQYEQITCQCLQNEEHIVDIGIGNTHSTATTTRGRIFTWGWNDLNQCLHSQKQPVQADFFKDKRIIQASCGDDHTLVLDNQGQIWTFGDNSKGQLGQGHYDDCKTPQSVQVPSTRQVKATGSQNFAVTFNNELFMWPYETILKEKVPNPIKVLADYTVSQIACGYNFALILVSSGQVFSFGINNSQGQQGHGDKISRTTPELIDGLSKEKIAQIDCGFKHSIARSTLGKVFTWGWGGQGQLGHGNFNSSYLPQLLLIKGQRLKAIQIAAGWQNSVFMLENRKLLNCGGNSQLGNSPFPIEIQLHLILPEIFGQRNNFEVIKVKTQWSRSISITSVVVADLRHLNVPKIKLNTALNMLATKWINDTIEPPIVEGLAPYYPAVSFKKSAKKITKKTGNSNLEQRLSVILQKPQHQWTNEEKALIERITKRS